jgi:lipid-binding SYLF domain-containing protein
MLQLMRLSVIVLIIGVFCGFSSMPSHAGTAAEIDKNVDKALAELYAKSPEARSLAKRAKGILLFPKILKGGFIIGAQAGEGALRQNGKSTGYYASLGVSYGLQAGVQWFGYAMFFMNDSALSYLDKSGGWEIGSGPSIVILDEGKAASLSTTTAKEDIYAFFFGQKGLMAGLGLQGTKITKIIPDKN